MKTIFRRNLLTFVFPIIWLLFWVLVLSLTLSINVGERFLFFTIAMHYTSIPTSLLVYSLENVKFFEHIDQELFYAVFYLFSGLFQYLLIGMVINSIYYFFKKKDEKEEEEFNKFLNSIKNK